MASILDRYGIKEVADVCFYEINDDGTPGKPVLYLDTLKVSTIEQSASQAEAKGGKGNAPLIIWDFGKEVNVTLTDALFSAKSLAIMFGNGTVNTTTSTIKKTVSIVGTGSVPDIVMPDGSTIPVPTTGTFYDETGNTVADGSRQAGATYYYTFDMPTTAFKEITISSATFPGTYYVTGDTYSRRETTGKDELK